MGTAEFGEAVIARLGKTPQKFKPVHYRENNPQSAKKKLKAPVREKKALDGIDIFVDFTGSAEALAEAIKKASPPLALNAIFNRGVRVWPERMPETACVESWRCRFKGETPEAILETLQALTKGGLDCIKTENLYTFDGKPGYTVAQDAQ